MKKFGPRSVLGFFILIFGCWWVYEALISPLMGMIGRTHEPIDYLFYFLIIPMISIPGGVAAFYGFRIIKNNDSSNIVGGLGVVSLFFVFWLAGSFESFFGEEFMMLFMFLATLIMIPIYVFGSQAIVRLWGNGEAGNLQTVWKWLIGILAIEIWLAGSEFLENASSAGEEYAHHIMGMRLGPLVMLIPAIVAWLFYKLGIKALNRRGFAKVEYEEV